MKDEARFRAGDEVIVKAPACWRGWTGRVAYNAMHGRDVDVRVTEGGEERIVAFPAADLEYRDRSAQRLAEVIRALASEKRSEPR